MCVFGVGGTHRSRHGGKSKLQDGRTARFSGRPLYCLQLPHKEQKIFPPLLLGAIRAGHLVEVADAKSESFEMQNHQRRKKRSLRLPLRTRYLRKRQYRDSFHTTFRSDLVFPTSNAPISGWKRNNLAQGRINKLPRTSAYSDDEKPSPH